MPDSPPRIAVTLGDPRGIGPEIVADALESLTDSGLGRFLIIGPDPLVSDSVRGTRHDTASIGAWEATGAAEAGRLSVLAVEHGVQLALNGEVDGVVTAPISKSALAAAGYPFPGHTELLRDRCGVPDVAMIMAAEETTLGGPMRMALLTVHIPLREVPAALTVELAVRRSAIAARALQAWWGIARPRLAFAGVNPHASEGGLFGDEEARVLEPAAATLARRENVEVVGIFPADTVFRRCACGDVDAIVVPYHDVGLAVLKTVAGHSGVNVTAGLPFPRTSPDHGTAFDIAGTGRADPRSMIAAIRQCVLFCRRGVAPG